MLGKSFRLFTVFGIEIKINPGWAIIAALVAWSLAQGIFPELYKGLDTGAYWAMAVAAVLGLAVSIVLHELSHSLVAAWFGTRVSSITLFMFGGVAALEEDPKAPFPEFMIALAGPIMSLVLSGLFFSAAAALGGVTDEPIRAGVFHYLGLLNLVLAVFNLIPAFPMDGGRALRAALWARSGDIKIATKYASNAGKFFGSAFMGLGFVWILLGNFVGGIWWMLIGGFIRGAAINAFMHIRIEDALSDQTVSSFMTATPDTVPAGITVREFVDQHLYQFAHDIFPVIDHGVVVGVVGAAEVREVPQNKWQETCIDKAMGFLKPELLVTPNTPARLALAQMQKNNLSRLIVADQGRLCGVIVLKDLLHRLFLMFDLEMAED